MVARRRVCAHVVQAFGFFEVRAIDLGVVLQLTRLLDAVVERLTVVRRLGSLVARPGFEQVPSFLGQHDRDVRRARDLNPPTLLARCQPLVALERDNQWKRLIPGRKQLAAVNGWLSPGGLNR